MANSNAMAKWEIWEIQADIAIQITGTGWEGNCVSRWEARCALDTEAQGLAGGLPPAYTASGKCGAVAPPRTPTRRDDDEDARTGWRGPDGGAGGGGGAAAGSGRAGEEG